MHSIAPAALAAGTIVVKEAMLDYRARTDRGKASAVSPVAVLNVELTTEERKLLAGFVRRRPELLPDARQQIAERLARPLHEKYGGQWQDAESYIDRLMQDRHHES